MAFALPERLPVAEVEAGKVLWRVHPREFDAVWFGPESWDPPKYRFDAPSGEYRVCYLGGSLDVAVAETLLRTPGPRRVVAEADLKARSASPVPVGAEPLRLAWFHGPGLQRLGIPADVAHSHPYDVCRRIALAIWAHADAVDGLRYRSRWDSDELCVALFDRAAGRLEAAGKARPLDDRALILPVLERYGAGIV